MTSPAMRLGKWHQGYLYVVCTLLVLSGALWLLFHYFVRMPGQFGDSPHPLEPWWLCIHGLSAAAFLIGFDSVLPGHVRRAWVARRNRISGTFFFSLLALLIATGYGLYYLGCFRSTLASRPGYARSHGLAHLAWSRFAQAQARRGCECGHGVRR